MQTPTYEIIWTMVKGKVTKLRVICHQTLVECPRSPQSWLVILGTLTTDRPWYLNWWNEFP